MILLRTASVILVSSRTSSPSTASPTGVAIRKSPWLLKIGAPRAGWRAAPFRGASAVVDTIGGVCNRIATRWITNASIGPAWGRTMRPTRDERVSAGCPGRDRAFTSLDHDYGRV